METEGFLACLEERGQLAPQGQKERKGAREKRETRGRTAWDSQASLDPQGLRDVRSMCQMRREQWQACQDLRAGRATQAFPDLLDRRVTWVPKARRDFQGLRARRESQARSSAPKAKPWALPRKEPRENQAFEDLRVLMGGLGTRVRLASLDGRVAPV